MNAYQNGENINDRPAGTLAGVQPVLSSEGPGVGADRNNYSGLGDVGDYNSGDMGAVRTDFGEVRRRHCIRRRMIPSFG